MPRSTHPRASARSQDAVTSGRPRARRLRYARMLALGLVLAITGIAHTTSPPETSALAASAQAASARIAFAHEIPTQADADATVTVVSRNIYLGADVGSALELLPDMPAAAQLMWEQVAATDFSRRAPLLAAELAADAPDVVAIQEATTWECRPTLFGSSTVVFDFLAQLLEATQDTGVEYVLDPFGPTIVIISPRFTVKSTSRKTILLSYPIVTEFSDIKSVI